MMLRKPEPDELDQINEMIKRSKAHWGEACRAELTFTPEQLMSEMVQVSATTQYITGIVEVAINSRVAEISKLFVDPQAIGSGAGRVLYQWGLDFAKCRNATRLMIESDPFAQGFYERMGAHLVGEVASGSIRGRSLPLLQQDL